MSPARGLVDLGGEVVLHAAHLDLLHRGERLVDPAEVGRLVVVDLVGRLPDDPRRQRLVHDRDDQEVGAGHHREHRIGDGEDSCDEHHREQVADRVEALHERRPEDEVEGLGEGSDELGAVALEVHRVPGVHVDVHHPVDHVALFDERKRGGPSHDGDGGQALHDVHGEHEQREIDGQLARRRVPEQIAHRRDRAHVRLEVRGGQDLQQRDQRDQRERLEHREEEHRHRGHSEAPFGGAVQ